METNEFNLVLIPLVYYVIIRGTSLVYTSLSVAASILIHYSYGTNMEVSYCSIYYDRVKTCLARKHAQRDLFSLASLDSRGENILARRRVTSSLSSVSVLCPYTHHHTQTHTHTHSRVLITRGPQ